MNIYIFNSILAIALIIFSCTNKIEEAKKLINDKKSEEAISLLSEIGTTDKQYSEAQSLIKLEKSKIAYEKGLLKFLTSKYDEALTYFTQVEDDGESFPNLNKNIEETKMAIDLVKNIPGIYEGSSSYYFAGGYMITNGKMEIFKNLHYNIQIQNVDTYGYGFKSDYFTGSIDPQFTKFDSGIYGFILNLNSVGNSFGESAYFYTYDKYWVLQFNMKSTNNQNWVLKLLRSARKKSLISDENNKVMTDDNSNEKHFNKSHSSSTVSEEIFYENLDVMPKRTDTKIFRFRCESGLKDFNNPNPELHLELYIDRNGNVVDAGILTGHDGCGLDDDRLINEIKKYLKFKPGTMNNKQVACRIEYKLNVTTY